MQPDIETSSELFLARVTGTLMLLSLALCMALTGCERRERVLDVEAPGIQIEVDKKTDLDGTKSIEIKKEAGPAASDPP